MHGYPPDIGQKFVEQNTKNPLVPFLGAGENFQHIFLRGSFLIKFQRSFRRFIGVFFKFFHGGVADILVKFVFRDHRKIIGKGPFVRTDEIYGVGNGPPRHRS